MSTFIGQTKPGPDDVVFGTGDRPIDYSTSLRILKAAGRHAGIPWINWHSLRRFFANISLELGIPLEVRQYIMGHAYAPMTQHYTTVPEIESKRLYVEQSLGRCWGPELPERYQHPSNLMRGKPI